MTYIRTILSFALIVAMFAGSGLFLLRIGAEVWLPTPGEILDAPPEEAVFGCIWLLALSVVAWLLCSALLSVCAYTARIPAAIRAAERMTVGPVRRLARRLAALILAMGSISASYPAGAANLPPVPIVASYEQEAAMDPRPVSVPGASTPVVAGTIGVTLAGPARTGEPGGRFGVSTPVRLRSGVDKAAKTGEHIEYVVQPGDSMWSVSSAYLRRNRSDPVPGHEVTHIWRQVVDLNRTRVRSGDPDLIFPGEILLLPVLTLPDGL